MTQDELYRAVSNVTGETMGTIAALGFSIATPEETDFDPEPVDIEDRIVDWDEVQAARHTPLVPVLV